MKEEEASECEGKGMCGTLSFVSSSASVTPVVENLRGPGAQRIAFFTTEDTGGREIRGAGALSQTTP